MRFLVDEQLPPALARWLGVAGYAADHVSWRGLGRAADEEVWREALKIGAVIISKDEDFARRRMLAPSGPPVVWVRIGNTRTATLLQTFASAMPRIVEALAKGEGVVELR